MENKPNPSTIIKWLGEMNELLQRYGFLNILKSLILIVVSIIIFAFLAYPSKFFDMYNNYMFKKHNSAIEYRLEIDPLIRATIRDIKYDLDADRVFVLELHNGSMNINGLHFLYVDMRYEDCMNDVEYIANDYKDLDVSRFPFINHVYDNYKWNGNMNQLENIDGRLAQRMRSNDADYLSIITLQGINSPLGFLGITYTDTTKVVNQNNIDKVLHLNGQKISNLLDGHKK